VRNIAAPALRPIRAVGPRLALAAALVLGLTAAPAQADNSQKATMLTLRSIAHGTIRVYLTSQAVRCEFLDRHIQMLWRAPKWDACLFSIDQGKYWQGRPSMYRSNLSDGMALFRPGDASALKSTTYKKTTVDGLPCLTYKLEPTPSESPSPSAQSQSNSAPSKPVRTWQSLMAVGGEINVLETPRFPADVSKSMCYALGAVPAAGLPISMNKLRASGKVIPELRLISHKVITVDKDIFSLPDNLKQVQTPQAVTESKDLNQGFSELIRE
jgi:hypothetical protein